MGIFNEHSSGQQYARGIQGAPEGGFNLTADGNYDMVSKKLTNVGAPTSNTDAAAKKYVDDNSGGRTSSSLTIDSNIDMMDTYRILNLKSTSQPATKQYADFNFFFRNGSHPMTGNVNMNNNRIINLPSPNAGDQPATKSYTATNFRNVEWNEQNDWRSANGQQSNIQSPTSKRRKSTNNIGFHQS